MIPRISALLTKMTGPAPIVETTYEPHRNLITGVTNRAKSSTGILPVPVLARPNRNLPSHMLQEPTYNTSQKKLGKALPKEKSNNGNCHEMLPDPNGHPFSSARLGSSGQKANWRLFGLEAPWIWSEIIVELQSDGSVKERMWTSIDTHWNESGNVTGDKPFNDLKIYRGENGPQSTGGGRVFRKIGHLSMENSVEDFINSATGARPEPPVPPSRQ